MSSYFKLFIHSQKLKLPTDDRNTEASSRVSVESQQDSYLWQTFSLILRNWNFDFNFFFWLLKSGLSEVAKIA